MIRSTATISERFDGGVPPARPPERPTRWPRHQTARIIGTLALRSLHAEVMLWPKPGLVTPRDSGSHADMDIRTFMRSLRALRGYFSGAAALGACGAPFSSLQQLGMRAESRMLGATGGVNTHRGAIFTLGLLAAAAGWALARELEPSGRLLSDVVMREWGLVLQIKPLVAQTHGTAAALEYGAGGASREAAGGFPTIFDVGVRALREARRRGLDERRSAVHALFRLMADVEDTNVLHRGGRGGLELVQDGARAFLARGGTSQSDWERGALTLHHALVRRNLSPGGSADLLAASQFVLSVEEEATRGVLRSAMPGAGWSTRRHAAEAARSPGRAEDSRRC